MSSTAEPAVSLQDVLCTPLLVERPLPPRDIVAEHAALIDLISHSASGSPQLLERLVAVAVELCDAGSAGVSLLEPDPAKGEGIFRWVAMAGEYQGYVGGTTPEFFSPCGTCLALGSAQLYRYPARLFTYLADATPAIVEGLVIPLCSGAGFQGTIWIVSHEESRRFTARDVEVMTSLAAFTSSTLALQRARDEAEAANRAKDEFLAVVSHELRRPLTAIVGWSELLLAGQMTPATAARAIEALYNNARRQRDMIEDLLDASRALTGSLALTEKAMDLTAVLRSAIEVVAGQARARGVELVADMAIDGSLPFFGDAERLHQVVGNLLGNAVKFTPSGGGIFVGVQVTTSLVEISVRDTGIGIAPDLVPLMFETFRKADASSTSRDSGLGLGLAIARRLVELHQGTLEAQSDGEGRGALFTIKLPAHRLRADPSPLPLPPANPIRTSELAGVTILVVDDEPDIRDVLSAVLQDAGATVVAVEGVDDALTALARQPIDVMVTDIGMPGKDGYELLAMLGGDDARPRPALAIAVTARASALERRRVLAFGFDHHVAKPFERNALVRLIARSARPHVDATTRPGGVR